LKLFNAHSSSSSASHFVILATISRRTGWPGSPVSSTGRTESGANTIHQSADRDRFDANHNPSLLSAHYLVAILRGFQRVRVDVGVDAPSGSQNQVAEEISLQHRIGSALYALAPRERMCIGVVVGDSTWSVDDFVDEAWVLFLDQLASAGLKFSPKSLMRVCISMSAYIRREFASTS